MLYDKNDETFGPWGFLLLIVLCFVLLILCSGCASGPESINDDIVKYQTELSISQERVRELESRVTDLQGRIGRTTEIARASGKRLEDIQRRAGSITSEIDKLCFLFEQYEFEVQRIIYEICTNGGTTQDTSDD